MYPYVSYCLPVWGNSSIGNVNKVNQIHKRATRLMQAGYNNENSLSKPILSVPKLFTFSTILKFYKYVGSHETSYLGNKIAELLPVHSHFTRFANDSMFNTPAYNEAQSKKIIFQSIQAWNLLPEEIKQIVYFPKFKRDLKTWLGNSQHFIL